LSKSKEKATKEGDKYEKAFGPTPKQMRQSNPPAKEQG
jgi:hypothetical protein